MTAAAASTMPDYTGCMVDQRFQLLRMLGSGTYGVVYHAVDTRPSSTNASTSRAVKMIRKAGRKPSELAAARREISLHSLVSSHPNIVTVYDAYEDDHYFYIIMDLCRGGDLFEPICRRIYVDNDALLRRAFVSLIDAVDTCHRAHVYHRDLKPENILISEDRSQLYLADFGLATNRSFVEEFYCGTAAYMSPECIGRMSGYKPYNTSPSDVWALGVILVNMVSGRNPWERATLDDPCYIQFIENPDFLFDMLPISEGANDILRQAFVLNPLTRITLPALRRAVLELDTFFRYEDDELSVIGEYALDATPAAETPRTQSGSAVSAAEALEVDIADVRLSMSASDGISAVPAAPEPRPRTQSCHPTLPVPEFPGFSSGSAEGSASSRASSGASSVLITPEPTAVVPGSGEEDICRASCQAGVPVARSLISHFGLEAQVAV